jgi:hypothetical protein
MSRADSRLRATAIGTAVLVALVLCASDAWADGKSTYRVDDPSLVYLGNPRLFKKPCEISADRVYRAIPEYQEILEKNLTDKDVRYHFLMKKASDKFTRAVKATAEALGHDLVAATGAVIKNTNDAPVVPDATDATIQRLPS